MSYRHQVVRLRQRLRPRVVGLMSPRNKSGHTSSASADAPRCRKEATVTADAWDKGVRRIVSLFQFDLISETSFHGRMIISRYRTVDRPTSGHADSATDLARRRCAGFSTPPRLDGAKSVRPRLAADQLGNGYMQTQSDRLFRPFCFRIGRWRRVMSRFVNRAIIFK